MAEENFNNVLKKSFIGLLLIAIVFVSGCLSSLGYAALSGISGVIGSIIRAVANFVAQGMGTIFTWNPTVWSSNPADISPAIRAIQPIIFYTLGVLYILLLIVNGIYFIWGAISPATRAQCKERIQRLILSMILVIVSPLLFQFMLELNNSIVESIFNTAGLPIGSTVFFTAITVIVALSLVVVMFFIPGLIILPIAGFVFGLIMILIAPILIAVMRYVSLVVLAAFFPLVIFMYFIDLTKDLGARFIRMTLVWIFTPIIMAIFFVIMNMAITVTNFWSIAGFTSGLLALAGFALMSMAPLMMSGMLNVIGASFVHVGRTRSNPRLIFVGSLMMGYGAGAFTQMAFESAGAKSGLQGKRAGALDEAQLAAFRKAAAADIEKEPEKKAEQAPGPGGREKLRGFGGASLREKMGMIVFWKRADEELIRDRSMWKYMSAQQRRLEEYLHYRDNERGIKKWAGMGWSVARSLAVSGFDVLRPMGDFAIGLTHQIIPPSGLLGRSIIRGARRLTGYWEYDKDNKLRWVHGETPIQMIGRSAGSILRSPVKMGVVVGLGVSTFALGMPVAIGTGLILTPLIAGAALSMGQKFGRGLSLFGIPLSTDVSIKGRREDKEGKLKTVEDYIGKLTRRRTEREALRDATTDPRERAKLEKDIRGLDSRISGLERQRDWLHGALNKYDSADQRTIQRDTSSMINQEYLRKLEGKIRDGTATEQEQRIARNIETIYGRPISQILADRDFMRSMSIGERVGRIAEYEGKKTELGGDATKQEALRERQRYSQHIDQEYLKRLDERLLAGTATAEDQRMARNIEAIYGRPIHEILRDKDFMGDVGILSKEERRARGLPEEARMTEVDKGLSALEGSAAKIKEKVEKRRQLTPEEEQTRTQYNDLLAGRDVILAGMDSKYLRELDDKIAVGVATAEERRIGENVERLYGKSRSQILEDLEKAPKWAQVDDLDNSIRNAERGIGKLGRESRSREADILQRSAESLERQGNHSEAAANFIDATRIRNEIRSDEIAEKIGDNRRKMQENQDAVTSGRMTQKEMEKKNKELREENENLERESGRLGEIRRELVFLSEPGNRGIAMDLVAREKAITEGTQRKYALEAQGLDTTAIDGDLRTKIREFTDRERDMMNSSSGQGGQVHKLGRILGEYPYPHMDGEINSRVRGIMNSVDPARSGIFGAGEERQVIGLVDKYRDMRREGKSDDDIKQKLHESLGDNKRGLVRQDQLFDYIREVDRR